MNYYFRQPNLIREDIRAPFGLFASEPVLGESFDANNDLFLADNGKIYPRHDWQGPVIDTAQHSSVSAACQDALINYNRATMRPEDFNDFYGEGDSASESMMLYGCV